MRGYYYGGINRTRKAGWAQRRLRNTAGEVDRPRLLQRSVEQLGLSARGYHRILKIARTIADMDNKELLQLSNIAEVVQYRKNG